MTTTRKIKARSVILDEPVAEEPRPVPVKPKKEPKRSKPTRQVQLAKLPLHPDQWLKVEVAPTNDVANGATSWYRKQNGIYAEGVISSMKQLEEDGTYSIFARYNTKK